MFVVRFRVGVPNLSYPNFVLYRTAFGFIFPMKSFEELYERYCKKKY